MKSPWLAPRARIVVHGQNDDSLWGEASLEARPLARLNWTRDGKLIHEQPLDTKGKGHALEIQRSDAGRPAWCAQWVHGKQHGLVIQLDERGRPALVTRFVRGRGTDIWMSGGQVSEVRELADGQLHEWVRWGDPRRPWEEGHFVRGQRHGIFREWDDGTLRKGFRGFMWRTRGCLGARIRPRRPDASLPRYDERDDVNHRPMPPVVREALARAKDLRRELALRAGSAGWGTPHRRLISEPVPTLRRNQPGPVRPTSPKSPGWRSP